MATPDDVALELLNNNDLTTVYDGAGGPLQRRTGSLRNAVMTLVWDLLRFQKPGNQAQPFNPNNAVGLRDSVSRLVYVAEQNNKLLRAIAAKVGADITGI